MAPIVKLVDGVFYIRDPLAWLDGMSYFAKTTVHEKLEEDSLPVQAPAPRLDDERGVLRKRAGSFDLVDEIAN